MSDLLQELRQSIRGWARRPGFAFVIVATLALGIGANVAVYTVVDGVLLEPLPYPSPERLGLIETELPRQDSSRPTSSGPEFLMYRENVTSLESIGAIWYRPGALTDDASEPEDIDMGFISAGFLRMLGVPPALGRFVAEEEDVPNGPHVIVLSYGLWQRRYGGGSDILGRRIELDGVPHTVVGVMPERFRTLVPPDAGVPERLAAWVPWGGTYDELPRTWRVFTLVARLAEGSDFPQARAELRGVAADLRENFPEDYEASGLDVELRPLGFTTVAHVRPTLLVLLVAVGFVFLVACANVANLMLVRASGKDREMALRVALGADRLRLLRQLAIESAVLSFLGAGLGIVLARAGVEALKLLDPGQLPRLADVSVGGDVLLIAVLVAVVTALVFGVVSSLHVSHGSARLGVGARSQGDVGRQRVRRLLIAFELALSVVLLTGAGLLARSFLELSRVDPGFETSGVLTAKLSLVDSHFPYRDPRPIAGFYRSLTERLDELPEVRAVGAASALPLDGSYTLTPYAYETPEGVIEWESVAADYRSVTPGFLEAMSARLVEGRLFEWTDDLDHPNVVIVDDKLAEKVFPGGSAVGQRLKVETFVAGEWKPAWAEIVGVVEHLLHHPAQQGVEQVYLPHQQSPLRTMAIALQSTMDPSSLVDTLRREARQLSSDQPVQDVRPMDAYLDQALAPTRFALSLLGLFAAVSVVVASIGLYGVISYSVGERTREIGVRLALGATPWDVRRGILLDGFVLTIAGVSMGLAGALGLSRFLQSQLYGVSATDPVTFVAIPTILAAVSLVAIYVPARRASRLDATLALRAD